GTTYCPVGEIQGLTVDWQKNKALAVFCKIGAACNESRLSIDEDMRFIRAGEPTEAAVRVLVEKLGCPDKAINSRCHQLLKRAKDDAMAFSNFWMKGLDKQATLEFTRDRKSMSCLCSDPSNDQGNVLYVKGAPESILERCTTIMLPDGTLEPITDASRKAIQARMIEMAKDALRTLALAAKFDLSAMNLNSYDGPAHPGHAHLTAPENFVKVETELTFVGMVGIIDPPRTECKQAIEDCRVAGIAVIMITGDNKVTAESVAQKIGILQSTDNLSRKSFTGKEFDDLSDTDKVKVLEHIMAERDIEGAVFSRTEPKHKQVIVKILKSIGEITAMTGDGVNDAPALKQADIGIAMGITGTEVAKEAADMVLADDNFSTIVSAVEEGRSIYNNMKAFIRYLISSNIGEVASIFFTAALGIPEGLAPVQLLWVNLVTDGLPATALGFNPPDLNVMQKPPRRKDDNLISGWVFFRYMVVGLYVGFATNSWRQQWAGLTSSIVHPFPYAALVRQLGAGSAFVSQQCSDWKSALRATSWVKLRAGLVPLGKTAGRQPTVYHHADCIACGEPRSATLAHIVVCPTLLDLHAVLEASAAAVGRQLPLDGWNRAQSIFENTTTLLPERLDYSVALCSRLRALARDAATTSEQMQQ
ncbi:unnamed protein product, partial [Polarella glacialis]